MPETIVLVGLMGAGKSHIGRELAKLTANKFYDADHEIEEAAGCSISDIFANYGEQAFRDGEKKVIARLLDEKPIILATGGGAFMNDETRGLILENAISVWLKADLEVLVERTSRTNHRPLLQQGDAREILQELIDKRYPIYAEADIEVTTGQEAPRQMAETVLKAVTDYINS